MGQAKSRIHPKKFAFLSDDIISKIIMQKTSIEKKHKLSILLTLEKENILMNIMKSWDLE